MEEPKYKVGDLLLDMEGSEDVYEVVAILRMESGYLYKIDNCFDSGRVYPRPLREFYLSKFTPVELVS